MSEPDNKPVASNPPVSQPAPTKPVDATKPNLDMPPKVIMESRDPARERRG